MKSVSQAYTDQTLVLDGQEFLACEFRRSKLIYAGGQLPRFTECAFDRCEWIFAEAAERTLAHLRFLLTSGTPELERNLLAMIGR